MDIFKAYRIYLDQDYLGAVRAGQTKEFAVADGKYTLYANVGRYGSNTLAIAVEDSTVEIEAGNALTRWKKWLFPYTADFIPKDGYLFLREQESVDEPQA
ncbi:MAG: hypothetical protein FWC72_00800 [Oscillospiraceae bacterium]|nr:hypothetical protein [Oscillospiraceae bacterium]